MTPTPEQQKDPALAFVLAELERDNDAPYADVRAKAEQQGLRVYPLLFGRARRMLGLVGTPEPPSQAAGNQSRRSKSDQIRELLQAGLAAREIADKVGCRPQLVYAVKARDSKAESRGRSPARTSKDDRGSDRTPAQASRTKTTSRSKNPPAADGTALDRLDEFVAAIERVRRERDELALVIAKIRELVDGVGS